MLFALFVGSAAAAHAFLDHAVPPVGATLVRAPPTLELFFTEPIELRLSGVQLATVAGNPVNAGPASVDPRDPTVLVVPLPPLPPGRYRASWHVVSVDTHRTEGSYQFEVAR